ncbi:MAG: hydroxyacylglutathione hydrolase [Xanthomonadales bacterium]|nr:hydroxyacylglutathione hydrolase [Xanthomonadales bacterium]
MPATTLDITAIPALTDNYIWLLDTGDGQCAVVDPGEAQPVLDVLEPRGLDLRYILLTHHHFDHVDGVPELLEHTGASVYGPVDDRLSFVDTVCREGQEIRLDALGLAFQVLDIPAHTRSHIAFYGHGALFCGDTLFSIGCGRLFEGTAPDMQRALDKLAALPVDTRVFCAHEYTQSNCAFALAVEPDNTALQHRASEVDRLRSNGEITLPSTLGEELSCNPFMRTREDAVIEAARRRDPQAAAGASTMAVIRAWKDRF